MGFRGIQCFYDKLKSLFQEKLVSGENIKTINGVSILGEGDIDISGDGAAASGNWLSTDTGGEVHGPVQVDEELEVLGSMRKMSGADSDIAVMMVSDSGIAVTDPEDTSVRTYYTCDGIRNTGMDDEGCVYATDGSFMRIGALEEKDINEICI